LPRIKEEAPMITELRDELRKARALLDRLARGEA
jgi:hypothetical protein